MLLDRPRLAELKALNVDLTIIGGGPVGLVSALAARAAGARVLLLESGGIDRDPAIQSQSDDTIDTPDTHHAGPLTTSRRLGGAGHLWGGRCVPFDPLDFKGRSWLAGCIDDWPVTAEDLDPYLAPALDYLGAGDPVLEDPLSAPLQGHLDTDTTFSAHRLERWTADPRIERRHMAQLRADPDLHVALGCSVCSAKHTGDRITHLEVWTEAEGSTAPLPVGQVILAAGGLASTRLLLALQANTPALFGGMQGSLGRFYMGHVNGQIADITFEDSALQDAFCYYTDTAGSYIRRRITPGDQTQQDHQLSNVAFWPVVPEISDARHRSGPLSAVFLGLSMPWLGPRLIAEAIRLKHIGPPPYRRLPHLRNLLTDPLGTLGFVPSFIWQRYGARTRVPGFFLRNPGQRYGLEFHAEHLPNAESRITLDPTRRDRTGLPHARVDFRFTQDDAAPILRAHDALEDWLKRLGLGRLSYRYGPDVPAKGIFEEAKHGNHQIGTARMGHDAGDGVVDRWGRCFDLSNLHVASTAVLRSSSQANPTLAAVQLALRTVAHLQQTGALTGQETPHG